MAANAEDAVSGERVWIALDTASQSDAALSVGAALARGLRAQLACLFIEDINLLRLAALPLAAETSLISARSRPLASADLERHLRGQAAGIERELAQMARHAGLPWSFEVRRGKPLAEAMSLAANPDVMVIAGRRLAPRMGRTAAHPSSARASAGPAPPKAPGAPGGSLVLFFDASPGALRLLALAGDLATRRAATLELLLPGQGGLPQAHRARLESAGLKMLVRQGMALDAAGLSAQARRPDVQWVFSPKRPDLINMQALRKLALEMHCPLVLG